LGNLLFNYGEYSDMRNIAVVLK